jgi:hypothetical protein
VWGTAVAVPPSNYQITALSGTNTSRTIQVVFRFNW